MTTKVKGQGRKVTWCAWEVLADRSRTKRSRNTKIGRKVAHPTSNSVHQFQCQGSKVKVTRSTNAETGSASYLPKGKAYQLLTWYSDGEQRSVLPTSVTISKVKGQGREVTLSIWQVLAHYLRTKSPRNTKIGRKVAITTRNNACHFQGQRSKVRVTRSANAETESASYL